MKKLIERFVNRGESKRIVTVEIVATVEVDADAPSVRMMVDHNLVDIPLKLAPTGPGPDQRSEILDVDVLTVQYRINEGRAYLDDKPKRMPKPPKGVGGGTNSVGPK